MSNISLSRAVTNLDLLFGAGELEVFVPDATTSVMCYGPPGAGKTVFLLSLARDAARQGRSAIFITFAHKEGVIQRQVESFNWLEVDSKSHHPWEYTALHEPDIRKLQKMLGPIRKGPGKGLVVAWAIDEKSEYDLELFKALCKDTIALFGHRDDLGVIAIDGINRLRLKGLRPQASIKENRLPEMQVSGAGPPAHGRAGSGALAAELSEVLRLQTSGALLCMSAESSGLTDVNSDRSVVLEEAKYQSNVVFELATTVGPFGRRGIRVEKARTQKIVSGWHELEIYEGGMRVFPDPGSWEHWKGWCFRDQFSGSRPGGSPALAEDIEAVETITPFKTGKRDEDTALTAPTSAPEKTLLRGPDSTGKRDEDAALIAPIGASEKTFLRGPDSTGKRYIAASFIGRIGDRWNGWAWDFDWAADEVARRIEEGQPILECREAMCPTVTPAQLFHGIAGAARTYMRNWIKSCYTPRLRPRAVIVHPGLLAHTGLAPNDVYRYVEALTGLLCALGYHVLVIESIDKAGEHALDPIFENVYVTERRPHLPSRRRCPWLHVRREGGSRREEVQRFRLRFPKSESAEFLSGEPPEVWLIKDDAVVHTEDGVNVPTLVVRLQAETQAQRDFKIQVQKALEEHTVYTDREATKVLLFDPEGADAVRRGLLSHRYQEHLNDCLVECFDESWIPELVPKSHYDRPTFSYLWKQSEDTLKKYPKRSLGRVARQARDTGDDEYFALPLFLDVTLFAVDLKFLVRGLRIAFSKHPADVEEGQEWDSRWAKLSVSGSPTSLHNALREAAWGDWRKRKGGDLTLADWAWFTRLAHNAQSAELQKQCGQGTQQVEQESSPEGERPKKEKPEEEKPLTLMQIVMHHEETRNCFMLGFLLDRLARVGPGARVDWRDLRNSRSNRESGNETSRDPDATDPRGMDSIYEALQELHYVFCLTGCEVVPYQPESDKAESDKADELGIPLIFEWFSTYRPRFGPTRQPAQDYYYYLARPKDLRFFTGDWYLGVLHGSQAEGRGKEVVDQITGGRYLRNYMVTHGVGLPPEGDRALARKRIQPYEYNQDLPETYRFDIPAQWLWRRALSRLDLPGYTRVWSDLADSFRQIMDLLLYSARDLEFSSSGLAPPLRKRANEHLAQNERTLRKLIAGLLRTIGSAREPVSGGNAH